MLRGRALRARRGAARAPRGRSTSCTATTG
jgi:hypothetical protein